MQDLSKAMESIIRKVLVKVADCPKCGKPMYAWKNKKANGDDRCEPTCMECGYHDLKMKADQETNRKYESSLKRRSLNFFKNSSIVPDKEMFEKNFENYRTTEAESKTAKYIARSFASQIISNNEKHMVLSGVSGVGKSHLAMATLWEVIKQSNYDKKCLFVNYRELLEQLKNSINDPIMSKVLRNSLLQDIKTTDLVVIDDLGAELGGKTKDSTTYNNDTLYSILEARQSKSLIVTTNLTGGEIRSAYGERVLSRIMKNSQGFTVTFKNSRDKRIEGI